MENKEKELIKLRKYMNNVVKREVVKYNPNDKKGIETNKATAKDLLDETNYLIFAYGRNWLSVPRPIKELEEYKVKLEKYIKGDN